MTDRVTRRPLERHGPHRHMAAAYRIGEPGAPKRARTAGSLTSTEDVVLQAVKTGYKIADEQILKAQDFARRMRGAAVRSEMGDLGDLVDHGLRLGRQLAILFLEFAETSTQPQAILKAMRLAAEAGYQKREGSESDPEGDAEGDGEDQTEEPPTSTGRRRDARRFMVPILVKSQHPTKVSLHLHKRPSTATKVFPLFSTENDAALRGVRFEEREGVLVLSVTVKDEGPGRYQGYAIDPRDNRPLGTIEVEVGA